MTAYLYGPARDERGSNVAQAAAVALAAAVLIAALLLSARLVGPATQGAFGCLIQALSGGGATCSGGEQAPAAPADDGSDAPWWQRLLDGAGDAAGWLWDNVLKPAASWLGDAWSWIWQDREFTWWKNALEWLREHGPLGYGAAAVLGFLGDFLFGLGSDGKFSWGGVVISTALTIAAFFTAGLTKIPAVARMLAKGGKLLSWLKLTGVWKWIAGTRLGRWLGKLGPGGLGDLLQGKPGTILREALPLLERRFPWLKRALDTTVFGKRLRDLVEPVGNYIGRLIKDGPFGLAKDIAGKLIKRFAPQFVKEALERLSNWKEWQGIWDWLRDPKLPWPFS